MLRNRLILAAAILATGVFASFYGGNIPYALFYLTLSIPVISFLYTFYVFVRVKVYQFIDKKRSEGKHYYSYRIAAANKFLRIYYAKVNQILNSH